MLNVKSQQLTLNLKEVQLLFDLSSNILDKTEEFLDGLNQSLEDESKGKVEKINSLKELMNVRCLKM